MHANIHKIDGLSNALTFANELVKEEGVPIQDYRIHQFNALKNRKYKNSKKYILEEKIKQRFLDDITLNMIIEKQEQEAKENEENEA